MRKLDLLGRRFERLIVVAYEGTRKRDAKHSDTIWVCKCDCGNEATVTGSLLTMRTTRSCGCLKIECSIRQGHANAKHQMSGTREHQAWVALKARCLNPSNAGWVNYGGRGISVCQEWLNSFEAFYRDMGPRPGPGYSIDRRDNERGYEPSNCFWATSKEQTRNRRSNRWLEIDGFRRTLSEWCELYNVRLPMVRQRILKGMNPKDALTKPSIRPQAP